MLKCSYNPEHCGPHNWTTIVDSRPHVRILLHLLAAERNHGQLASAEYGLNVMLYAENKHGHWLPDFRLTPDENWEASRVRLVIHERDTHPHPDWRARALRCQHGQVAAVLYLALRGVAL